MQVDVSQWRAAIGLFRSSLCAKRKIERFLILSMLKRTCKLYLFCCIFIFISTFLLPLSMSAQIFAKYSFYPKCHFLFIFARLYSYVKTLLYMLLELINRLPRTLLILQKDKILTDLLVKYCYFYSICIASYTMHTQWSCYRIILLSGDIETNPGPDLRTLNFCSWNLNSICAYEFLRVSLLEAYNSVYDYDLIGIVETHLDTSVDENKLAIDGYTSLNSNHPQNVKRGGVGLYIKESFPAKKRSDLEILSEWIVCEVQIKRKKYFFSVLYRSPSQSQEEYEEFTINFDLMLSKMAAENPHCVIITGDFNARSVQWWENDLENDFGKVFEPFTSDLGLH